MWRVQALPTSVAQAADLSPSAAGRCPAPEAAAAVNALVIQRQSEGAPVSIESALVDRLMLANELAELQAALGNADATLDALEAAFHSGTGFRSLLSMKINRSYDFIREDPRFVALLSEVGLQ